MRIHTSEMRLHALQRVNEDPRALEVNWPAWRQDLTLHIASWPDLVDHTAPVLLWIGAEVTRPVLSNHETRTRLLELQVHNVLRVRIGFHGISLPILADCHRAAIRGEVVLIVGKLQIGQVRGAPKVRLGRIFREDFRGELRCRPHTPVLRSATRPPLPGYMALSHKMLLYITCAIPTTPSSLSM